MNNEINFTAPTNRGRKPTLYMVLDSETATLPFVKEWDLTSKQKQKIAIAKPLIYDLAWQIVDRKGNVYSQHSFLIQETFFVPNIFNTAYYNWKRDLYMERLAKGDIIVKTWAEATAILEEDLQRVNFSTAYNAMFDFKKAITFTDEYIKNLYSSNYNTWERKQKFICQNILKEKDYIKEEEFDPLHFNFRNNDYPMSDLWGLACDRLINNDKYKMKCLELSMVSPSGLFFKTSAETTFRYLADKYNFEEEHTALKDVEIESIILQKALKKGKIEMGIQYLPFRELGETVDFIIATKAKNLDIESIENVIKTMYLKLQEYERQSSFATQLETKLLRLERHLNANYDFFHKEIVADCQISLLTKEIMRKQNYVKNLKVGGDAYERTIREIETLKEKIETWR